MGGGAAEDPRKIVADPNALKNGMKVCTVATNQPCGVAAVSDGAVVK